MTEEDKVHKRSRFFIKKEFQTGFILKFCMIFLFGIILSTGLLFFLSQDTLTSSYAKSGLEIRNTGTAILPVVILTNLMTLGLITLAAIVVLLYISHRIAGPIFRFEKDITRVAGGDLTVQINLRKKDQFQNMALALNRMIQSMSSRVAYVDARLLKIQTLNEEGKSVDDEILKLRTLIRESFILNP